MSAPVDHDHDGLVAMYGICTVCARATAAENLERRDVAMGRALAGASDDWKRKARKAIRKLADELDEFTTDEVWDLIPLCDEPRALGPLMVEAAEAGVIVRTERSRVSRQPRNHGRRVTIWTSVQGRLTLTNP